MRQEAMQVYHRYVALFALTDFERVIRDTLHNLRIADLCRDFGERRDPVFGGICRLGDRHLRGRGQLWRAFRYRADQRRCAFARRLWRSIDMRII